MIPMLKGSAVRLTDPEVAAAQLTDGWVYAADHPARAAAMAARLPDGPTRDALEDPAHPSDEPANTGDNEPWAVGELANWDSDGAAAWAKRKRIRVIEDGEAYFEGIEGGIPLGELV